VISLTADVVIVGFGPVGAVLAGLLGLRGLDVVVVEREQGVFALPRAAHVDHTGLRTIQELGCLDRLLPTMLRNPGLDFVTATGDLLIRVPGGQASLSDLPASMYFHQPVFDRLLREVAAGLPNVTVLLGTEGTSFRSEADAVVVQGSAANGDPIELTSQWVVGCDGASSSVRESAGIVQEDLEFEERWLVVDLILEQVVPTLRDHAVTVCDPRRPLYSIPMPSPRHRFEFMLLDGEDALYMQAPETVFRLLEPWIPREAARIERSAVYTFHGLVACEWRAGRLLIAGDAAHQMPPFLGQGMCSGIRDAANLAWKLERCVRGGAPDRLLDTYCEERRPHVRKIIEAAVQFGRVICTTDPVAAAERDKQFLEDPSRPEDRIPFALPTLESGDLVLEGGGELFPQWSSGNGAQRLDDVVGRRLLVIGRRPDDLDGHAAWWTEQVDALVVTPADLDASGPPILNWMDARGVDVVVVRPDRYVLTAGARLGPVTDAVADLLTGGGVSSAAPVHTIQRLT
jgi:3-(3-hydroxy-phenyl)propionate hydroxylase